MKPEQLIRKRSPIAPVWVSPKLVVAALAILALLCAAGRAYESQTGQAFQRELANRTSITWKDNPLGDGLKSIAATHKVAIHLDRRVDFTRLVTYSARDLPMLELVQKVAAETGNDAIVFGDLIYVGPPAAVARVGAIAKSRTEEMRKLPTARQRELLTSQSLAWPRLATPKDVLRTIAVNHKLRVVGADIPHDLWAAEELPPMTAAESLTLLLIGFDLTFELSPDGSAIRLAPLPDAAPFAKTYKVTPAQQKSIEDFVAAIEGASSKAVRGGVEVTANSQTHLAIERALAPRTGGPSEGSSKLYTLSVEQQPALAVLNAVAKQMGAVVEATEEAKTKGAARISFDVTDVSRDELIHAILDPVELEFEWRKATLLVK